MVHCFGAAYARLPAASTASLPSVPRAGSANSEVGGFEASRRGAQVRGGCPLLVVSWQCCMRHLLPWAVVDRMRAAAEVGSTQAAFFTGGCGAGTWHSAGMVRRAWRNGRCLSLS